MTGTSDQTREMADGKTLEPDTFWELVEKLLLRSSRDERLRQGHNLSLSALCRGYAVQTAQRTQKAKSPSVHASAKDTKIFPPAKSNSKKSKTGKSGVSSGSGNKVSTKASKVPNETATRTKSECNLKDHDVVYVKDTEIPASEKLWRFAIKNRKQKEGGERVISVKPNKTRSFPSARSNEAIYEGLKQRLEEARKIEQEEKELTKKEEPKKKLKHRTKSHKAAFHSCSTIKKDRNPTNTDMSIAKSSTTEQRDVTTDDNPTHSDSNQSVAHNQSQNNATSVISEQFSEQREVGGNNVKERTVSPEHVEAKKSLYDNVLKKRLHCGTQLETLNREIISKKVNPRLVLSRETTRKYAELKTEYLKLCYQESSLRHQIAMLQAEIYMMQNKNYHKRPAAVKTITLNSETAKLPHHIGTMQEHETYTNVKRSDDVLLFPRLKAPRPLIVPLKINGGDKKHELKDDKAVKRNRTRSEDTVSVEGSDQSLPSIGLPPQGVCSLYSLTTSLAERHPKRQPTALLVRHKSHEKLAHRLPKMHHFVCARE